MKVPSYTEEELVALLKKTSLLSLVVEGPDEAYLFRKLEKYLENNVNILVCDGCDKLRNVFQRRNEFSNAKVVFLTDKDMLIFKTESFLQDLIYTNGYSIENDIINGSNILDLLDDSEREDFDADLEKIIIWFNSEAKKFLQCKDIKIDIHPDCIYKNKAYLPDYKYLESDKSEILIPKGEELKYIRGKNLMYLIMRYTSYSKRNSKFGRNQLIDVAFLDKNSDFFKITLPAINEKITMIIN